MLRNDLIKKLNDPETPVSGKATRRKTVFSEKKTSNFSDDNSKQSCDTPINRRLTRSAVKSIQKNFADTPEKFLADHVIARSINFDTFMAGKVKTSSNESIEAISNEANKRKSTRNSVMKINEDTKTPLISKCPKTPRSTAKSARKSIAHKLRKSVVDMQLIQNESPISFANSGSETESISSESLQTATNLHGMNTELNKIDDIFENDDNKTENCENPQIKSSHQIESPLNSIDAEIIDNESSSMEDEKNVLVDEHVEETIKEEDDVTNDGDTTENSENHQHKPDNFQSNQIENTSDLIDAQAIDNESSSMEDEKNVLVDEHVEESNHDEMSKLSLINPEIEIDNENDSSPVQNSSASLVSSPVNGEKNESNACEVEDDESHSINLHHMDNNNSINEQTSMDIVNEIVNNNPELIVNPAVAKMSDSQLNQIEDNSSTINIPEIHVEKPQNSMNQSIANEQSYCFDEDCRSKDEPIHTDENNVNTMEKSTDKEMQELQLSTSRLSMVDARLSPRKEVMSVSLIRTHSIENLCSPDHESNQKMNHKTSTQNAETAVENQMDEKTIFEQTDQVIEKNINKNILPVIDLTESPMPTNRKTLMNRTFSPPETKNVDLAEVLDGTFTEHNAVPINDRTFSPEPEKKCSTSKPPPKTPANRSDEGRSNNSRNTPGPVAMNKKPVPNNTSSLNVIQKANVTNSRKIPHFQFGKSQPKMNQSEFRFKMAGPAMPKLKNLPSKVPVPTKTTTIRPALVDRTNRSSLIQREERRQSMYKKPIKTKPVNEDKHKQIKGVRMNRRMELLFKQREAAIKAPK